MNCAIYIYNFNARKHGEAPGKHTMETGTGGATGKKRGVGGSNRSSLAAQVDLFSNREGKKAMKENDLRNEYRKLKLSGELAASLGCTCSNCGSSESIEYHHIVPLHLGGTNRLTNIVPLCNRCHKSAHRGRHISHYINQSNGGRPNKVSDKVAFKALDMWADGQIGTRKLRQLMGLKDKRSNGGSAVNTYPQYHRWLKDRGYECVKNTLDCKATSSCDWVDGDTIVGKITYPDGSEESIRFHDTGKNDDVVYTLRGKNREAAFSEIKNMLFSNNPIMAALLTIESSGQMKFEFVQ